MALRIIAGQRRGQKLVLPSGLGGKTRPTTDLVREAIFNILADRVDDRPVLDLFSGSGALGLEALSRGAARVTFVERFRANAEVIKRNLEALRFTDRAEVFAADVYRWVRAWQADPGHEPWLVILAPPYAQTHGPRARILPVITQLIAQVPAGSTLAFESGPEMIPSLLPECQAWSLRRYGSTQVAILDVDDLPDQPVEPIPENPPADLPDQPALPTIPNSNPTTPVEGDDDRPEPSDESD